MADGLKANVADLGRGCAEFGERFDADAMAIAAGHE